MRFGAVFNASSARYVTDYFVEDAAYLRIKTIQMGYTLRKKWVTKLKLDQVRFYIQGQNLVTWTRFTGLDPGVSLSGSDTAMGIAHNYTPTPKQILFGIHLGL